MSVAVLLAGLLAAVSCATTAPPPHRAGTEHGAPHTPAVDGLPGMPPVLDVHDVYSQAGSNMLSPAVLQDPSLVYVPHTGSGDVWVIDPKSFRVIARYPAGREIQHVVPSWDMRTLYATDDLSDHVLSFDPRTGKPGERIPVTDPYNMYFTPDGRSAISVAEDHEALFWYDPRTWRQQDVTRVPACGGIDHGDFSADGRTAVFTCEFSGRVAVIDVAGHRLLRMIDMPQRHTHMGPQDIKLAPDGSAYYIADSDANGVWVLDGAATAVVRFLPTGRGAHGLYLNRDGRRLFVTNRLEGSISVLDAATGAEQVKWRLPGGGSPDMGNLTADGRQLWLSGRYDNAVYVVSTADGKLLARIPVGGHPHGLCVWPQPGRFSLGHTGITR
ncbi:YncE family protein [Saccharopolyspora rosea]|uniref:Beta-propeller fold lactonase family protein n=1 Tax=Saccharopolyspora rosea TaxID=524884 RepID=A0ABW3FUE9_9PSEU|nr:YncE family protein [Saccharopolyspora rosea]